MRAVEFWRSRPLVVALALGAVVGGAIGLLRPIAPGSRQSAEQEMDWVLPPAGAIDRFDEKRFASLRELPIWGAGTDAAGARVGADGKPVVPGWRLTGIILEPAPVALVLADGATAVTRIALGADLPDQGRLLAVSATGIVYERAGCRRQRALYSGSAPGRADACLPTEDPRGVVPTLPEPHPGKATMRSSDSPSGPTSSE